MISEVKVTAGDIPMVAIDENELHDLREELATLRRLTRPGVRGRRWAMTIGGVILFILGALVAIGDTVAAPQSPTRGAATVAPRAPAVDPATGCPASPPAGHRGNVVTVRDGVTTWIGESGQCMSTVVIHGVAISFIRNGDQVLMAWQYGNTCGDSGYDASPGAIGYFNDVDC